MHQFFNKRYVVILCFLLLFTALTATADDTNATSVLFINSNPINAEILIDGEPLLQKTPALLTGAAEGRHSITLRKTGYEAVNIELELKAGKTVISETELFNGNFIVSFHDKDSISLITNETKSIPGSFRIPSGDYSIIEESGDILISPIYPKDKLLTFTTTLFTASLLANLITTFIELDETGELFIPHSDKLVITETLTAITGLTELALLIDRHKFRQEFKSYKADLSQTNTEAENIFDNAQQAMTKGKLENALSGFSSIVSSYRDYIDFPEALYKIARLHIILGDTNLAISELNIIINNFPTPGIYDKACQTLALMYFNAGETENSRQTVEKMVFFDPLFSDTAAVIEEIGVDQVIENWARNPEGQVE